MTKINSLKHLATVKTYLVTYRNGRTAVIDTVLSQKALVLSVGAMYATLVY